jgi:spermidine synthase
MYERTLSAGILFLSLSVLVFELTLIRWLSVVVPSNLAFLGVTFALFGVAFGGVLVYGLPRHYTLDNFRTQLGWYCLLYGFASSVFVFVFTRFDFSRAGVSLIPLYVLPAIPFTLANICLSLVFKYRSELVDRFYFFDLVGAGMGVISAIVLMNVYSAANVFFASGSIGFLAACFLSGGGRKLSIAAVGCASVLGLVTANQVYDFVDVVYGRHGKETNNIFSKWNAFSRVSVQIETLPRRLLSLPPVQDIESLPEQRGIEIDSDAYTPVLRFDGNLQSVDFLRRDISSIGFSLSKPGQVLIIGPGGGRDVLMALLYDHHVTGVDINPIIIDDIMKDRLRDFSGSLYFHPQVEIIVAEGRSFIRGVHGRYDVIDIPLVDTFAATISGSLVLVENNLYTVEAFEDYLRHLKDDGILTISRWDFDGMRLVTLFLEACQRMGIRDPETRLVVLGNRHEQVLNNYLFKKTAFSQEEIAAVRKFAGDNNFAMTYVPGERQENDYHRFLTAHDKQQFAAAYRTNIKAVYDDNPFFFFIAPLSGVFHPFSGGYDGGLGNALVMAIAMCLLILLVPRTLFQSSVLARKDRNARFYLGYFACLGLGFIVIEISLIQKFVLYLEKPIYSFSVVIASALLFAGVGSFVSRYVDSFRLVNYLRIIGTIVGILLLLVSLNRHLIYFSIDFALGYKIVIAASVTACVSLLMGMLLPLGIKRLDATGDRMLIPWCWAINGASSVVGSVVAIFLAISLGFNGVLLVGGVLYLLSLVFIAMLTKPQSRWLPSS